LFTKALNEDIAMQRSTGRLFVAVCLFAGVGLFAPAVLAQGEEDSAAPAAGEAAPVRATPPDQWTSTVPPSQWPSSEQVAVPAASSPPPVSKPAARTGPPAEAGTPGWMLSRPGPVMSGLDWHGNLELDDGYVQYSGDASSFRTLKVYDSRGRFVLGPMLTHDLGHEFLGHKFFLRLTGQVVAWVRESAGSYYQINADDVYVQVGQQGLWDFMAGRFLTWRVFRKGLGFDLYTLEDTGARTSNNFTDGSWLPHMYEVNNIFMRDPAITPAGRAALHLYPTSWSGIELVGSYGHLDSSQNVLGGRLAFGIQPKDIFLLEHFSLLAGAEYQAVSPDYQLTLSDGQTPCAKCNSKRTYGAGGSAGFAWQPIDLAFSFAYGKQHNYFDQTDELDSPNRTFSLGGYLQVDAGSLFMPRSLIVGGAFFRTECRGIRCTTTANNAEEFDRHDQLAAYVAYPLGFNNAVVKLVLSEATGYQELLSPGNTTKLNATMYSARLRFAYYY
jgi:hypothetical protein